MTSEQESTPERAETDREEQKKAAAPTASGEEGRRPADVEWFETSGHEQWLTADGEEMEVQA